MSPRVFTIGLAAVALLVAGCGQDPIAIYRVPKEKDPELPMGAPDSAARPDAAPMAGTAVPTASGADLTWKAPSDWSQKPAAPMRKATFEVPGGGGPNGELSVTAFPGDVGGELANVNRWRGQVGLGPLSDADLDASVSRIQANGLSFTVVELDPAGDPAGKAILGAMVPFQGSTWFFKLSGDGVLIKASRPEFIEFLRTIKGP